MNTIIIINEIHFQNKLFNRNFKSFYLLNFINIINQ
jgi:hypothetical protein